jgi:hypothetical protein
MLFGRALINKAAPLQWLNEWLSKYAPNIQFKSVRMDQGRELGRSKPVACLFEQHGYEVDLTGAEASQSISMTTTSKHMPI